MHFRRQISADQRSRQHRDLLAASCAEAAVAVWSWVLMPNHVHLILVPSDEDGLRRALARVHRQHAGRIHARRKRTGHFWQGRFGAVAMDEAHLAAALRYVALNPVGRGWSSGLADWPWSRRPCPISAGNRTAGLTCIPPVRERVR